MNTLTRKCKKKTKERHVELGAARIERDEEDVRNIITCISVWLPNLWEKGHTITKFATGEIVTDNIKDDIIDLKEIGEIARDEFVGRFTQKNRKLNYYELFEKKTTKKKHSIPDDESQSFTVIFAIYDGKNLDLRKIMDYCVTSKSWAIVNEDEKSHNNNKHLFRNHLQNLPPISRIHKVRDNSLLQ